MKMRCWKGILYLLILLTPGCNDVFEFSPNQTFDGDSPVGINARNIEQLHNRPVDDTITIAFIGDSQRFYDEAIRFVDKVNTLGSVDFVLLAGDITDFGLLEEFEQINGIFSKLDAPYVGVIGNHDVQARGEETFERTFGALNFSFVYDSIKFIVHNTNGREYPAGQVPDLQWLADQFTDDPAVKNFVAVSHVPPFDRDFDKTLEPAYTQLLHDKNTLISLHGHIHRFKDGYPYNDGMRYMTSHSFDKRAFVLMKISNGIVTYSIIDY